LNESKEKGGIQMPKFFNKNYKHAYKRGNMVWVQGTIKNHPHHRMTTGKEFSKANINYVEKHWEEMMEEHFEQEKTLVERKAMLTFRDFLPRSLELRAETASEGSVRDYESSINKHILPMFGECKFDEITISRIKDWQKYLRVEAKLAQKTIVGIRAMFSGVLNHAIEEDVATTNAISQTKAPDKKLFIQYDEYGNLLDHKGREIEDKQLDPFTLDDVWKLIDAADGQFKLILTVLFFTGMRTGEMVTLKWSDIDWNNETIHIQRANNSSHEIGTTKTGTSRKVTILPIVMKALREQYKDTGLQGGFIFLAQDGGRYKTYDTFRKYHWKNLLLRTGYAYRKFYQTRHTFASIMLSKGEDIMWVSKIMLGHSEVATTYKFYAKYIKSKDKKHAAFLDDERTNSVQNINLNLGSA
jgi:integrase